MINALSIDLENWYSNEIILDYLPKKKSEYIIEGVELLLRLLAKYNAKATFFVLGSVALKYPQIIKKIYHMGHEIASHGYSHKTLYNLGQKEFELEIKTSVDLLKSIIGEKPIGFRAPCFSIDNSTKWAFEILEKYGFKYDSSIFPIKNKFYGVPNAPLSIYKPSKIDVAKHDPEGKIIEFPLTTLKFIRNIPIAGGFYLRLFPIWFLKLGYKKVNKTRPVILYVHPRDICNMMPQIKAPFFPSFVTYYGINTAVKKLEIILKEFDFKPIRDVLNEICRINHSN